METRPPKQVERDPSLAWVLSLIREKALDSTGLPEDQVDRNLALLKQAWLSATSTKSVDLSSVGNDLFSLEITSRLGLLLHSIRLTHFSQVETFLTKAEKTCELSDGFVLFLTSFLQEPIRRDLVVWKLIGDPPKPGKKLGAGAMGVVCKGGESLMHFAESICSLFQR